MFSVILYSAIVVGGLAHRIVSGDGFDNSGELEGFECSMWVGFY